MKKTYDKPAIARQATLSRITAQLRSLVNDNGNNGSGNGSAVGT